MSKPFVLLVGPSGSGKDTVGDIMVGKFGAQAVSMADPLKRFCQHIFGFTSEQLWGPSRMRNAFDPRFDPQLTNVDERDREFVEVRERFYDRPQHKTISFFVDKWCETHFPGKDLFSHKFISQWFEDLQDQALKFGLAPRLPLQTLGTEVGRRLNSKAWVNDAWLSGQQMLLGNGTYSRETGFKPGPVTGTFPAFVVIKDGRFPSEILDWREKGAIIIKMETRLHTSSAAQAAGVKGHSSETAQDQIPEFWYDDVLVNEMDGLPKLERKIRNLMQDHFYPRYY